MVTTTKTDELVERFNKWAIELQHALGNNISLLKDDSEAKARLARIDTLRWAINNLKRIRDEIDAEYDSKS